VRPPELVELFGESHYRVRRFPVPSAAGARPGRVSVCRRLDRSPGHNRGKRRAAAYRRDHGHRRRGSSGGSGAGHAHLQAAQSSPRVRETSFRSWARGTRLADEGLDLIQSAARVDVRARD
jgi:hypothetical protein